MAYTSIPSVLQRREHRNGRAGAEPGEIYKWLHLCWCYRSCCVSGTEPVCVLVYREESQPSGWHIRYSEQRLGLYRSEWRDPHLPTLQTKPRGITGNVGRYGDPQVCALANNVHVCVCVCSNTRAYKHKHKWQVPQFNIQQFYVLPTQCIYVFCVDLRTNSGYFPIQH